MASYALVGFEDSANVAEETRDPSWKFPRALFGGLVAAAFLYVLVGFVGSLVVEPETLASSSGPLLEMVEQGPLAVPTQLFSIIALMADHQHGPDQPGHGLEDRLRHGLGERGTRGVRQVAPHAPHAGVAIVFTTLISLGLIVTGGNLENLSGTTVVLFLVVFTIAKVSVLVLRRDQVAHPHFRIPAAMPVLEPLTCLLLLTRQSKEKPTGGASSYCSSGPVCSS